MISDKIKILAGEIVGELFGHEARLMPIQIQPTKKEFEGDLTLVVFPFVRISRKSPEETGEAIGNELLRQCPEVESFNTIKGFLNLTLRQDYWTNFLISNFRNPAFGTAEPQEKTVVLEYTGPNTNKPLHLGHVRNMVLGWSAAEILKANGYKVHKVNIYNDRGIAICKSMVAWIENGNGTTPESEGMKGDHFVGKYYVEYDQILMAQTEELFRKGVPIEEAKKQAPIYLKAQEYLRRWEAGDSEVLAIWNKMNGWVYEGFRETYASLGIDFDKDYFESQSYLKGKDLVLDGLAKGLFFTKEDGSVWVDMTEDGLDEKVLLRADGTSLYLTQDIGVALERHHDFQMDRSIYVVGDEQNYHFKALKIVMKKLGFAWADGIYHLSYGMVDLPTGKMKSREGTTVDADDLISQMIKSAQEATAELGKIEGFSNEEAKSLYRTIGLGALKFFLLRVNPQKRMLFNPEESIDLHGFTGPFVQYTYARIRSVLRKWSGDTPKINLDSGYILHEQERELLRLCHQWPDVVKEAGEQLDPAHIATYAFNLAKAFNKFYAEVSILQAETENLVNFRIAIASLVSLILKNAFALLGIEMPERM